MDEIIYLDNFVLNGDKLYPKIIQDTIWDERMHSRKTASYGEAYNYSQICYPYKDFPEYINVIIEKITDTIKFRPNNCLINYYKNGQSKMGFHADQIDILAPHTGIAIVSLGDEREIVFKNIAHSDLTKRYLLKSESLFYMSRNIQKEWVHSIPSNNSENGRLSLTFRQIKT